MRCRFSQENPDKPCFCSACHLSSQLFPRRQDGKIILPNLPASGGGPPALRASPRPAISQSHSHPPALPPTSFRLPTPLMPEQQPPVQSPQVMTSTTSGRADRGNRPRARSNTRTLTNSSSLARLRSGPDPITFPETPASVSSSGSGLSTSKLRPRSRSQTFLTTTTAVSNPYPIPTDSPQPKSSLDNRSKAPASESSSASTSAAIQTIPTPPLKFCPPFVASDRIADSEATKEGSSMIPWSFRRRKQKYRSGFDTGTGPGKGKTMFRYYGPDNDPPNNSDTSKKQ